MYAKEGFIRKSRAMHELSSNNPDLARQVFCILLGYGTLSCQAGSLPHATWVLMFLSGNRARGSHFSPLKQNAIYSLCAHSGDGPVGYPEGNAFILYPWVRGEPWAPLLHSDLCQRGTQPCWVGMQRWDITDLHFVMVAWQQMCTWEQHVHPWPCHGKRTYCPAVLV